MSREVDELLGRLAEGIEEEASGPTIQASQALRERVGRLLEDRRLEPEDPLLAERRRLHHRLEVIEAKAQAGRFADAREDLGDVDELTRELAEEIQARERWTPPSAPSPGLGSLAIVAAREARQRWRRALLVALPSGLAFALAPSSAGPGSPVLEALLALAALGGLGLAAGVLGEDRDVGRLHLLVGHGVSRAGVVAAKHASVLGLLALALAGPGVLAAVAGVGSIAGLGVPLAAASLLGLVLLGTTFAGLVLALEARAARWGTALATGVLAYVLVGPLWRAAFLAGADGGGAAGALGAELVYLASPVAAARSVVATAGQGSVATAGLLVLVAWGSLGLGFALWSAGGTGLAAPRRN